MGIPGIRFWDDLRIRFGVTPGIRFGMIPWIRIGMTLRIRFWGDPESATPTSWDANRPRRGRSQFPLLRLSGKRWNRATFMANMLDIEPPAQGQGRLCHPWGTMDRLPGERGDRDNPQEESGIPGAKIPSPLLHPTSSRSLARTCSSISSSTGATSYVYLEGPSRSGRVPLALKPQNPKHLPPEPQHPKLSPSNAHCISTSTGGTSGESGQGFGGSSLIWAPQYPQNPPFKPQHLKILPQHLPLHQHQGLLAGGSGEGGVTSGVWEGPPTRQPRGIRGSRGCVEGLGEETPGKGMVVQP